MNKTPVAEIEITTELVTALLEEQHPDLAHLKPRMAGEGWDNAMFRLGDSLAVRLPRRAAIANLVCHEQAWLPQLARQLPIPVPAPLRTGTPALGYPWRWSIVPWLPGRSAHEEQPAVSQGGVFGNFLRALHVAAPAEAPVNPFRGVPLEQRAAAMQERMTRLSLTTTCITARIRQLWQNGLAAPIDVPATWLHADLHPHNVLVKDGAISGIIDWGDVTSGDCATDLAAIWMLFPEPDARHKALTAYHPISEATLERAQAWAVFFGVMLLDTGLADHPVNAALGKKILQRLH